MLGVLVAALRDPDRYDTDALEPPSTELRGVHLRRCALNELHAAFPTIGNKILGYEEEAAPPDALTPTWEMVQEELGGPIPTRMMTELRQRWDTADDNGRSDLIGEATRIDDMRGEDSTFDFERN